MGELPQHLIAACQFRENAFPLFYEQRGVNPLCKCVNIDAGIVDEFGVKTCNIMGCGDGAGLPPEGHRRL